MVKDLFLTGLICVDKEASVHPRVKECIARGICCGTIDQLPQFFRIKQEDVVCMSCWNSCVPKEEYVLENYSIWEHCKCSCQSSEPARKKQKL